METQTNDFEAKQELSNESQNQVQMQQLLQNQEAQQAETQSKDNDLMNDSQQLNKSNQLEQDSQQEYTQSDVLDNEKLNQKSYQEISEQDSEQKDIQTLLEEQFHYQEIQRDQQNKVKKKQLKANQLDKREQKQSSYVDLYQYFNMLDSNHYSPNLQQKFPYLSTENPFIEKNQRADKKGYSNLLNPDILNRKYKGFKKQKMNLQKLQFQSERNSPKEKSSNLASFKNENIKYLFSNSSFSQQQSARETSQFKNFGSFDIRTHKKNKSERLNTNKEILKKYVPIYNFKQNYQEFTKQQKYLVKKKHEELLIKGNKEDLVELLIQDERLQSKES